MGSTPATYSSILQYLERQQPSLARTNSPKHEAKQRKLDFDFYAIFLAHQSICGTTYYRIGNHHDHVIRKASRSLVHYTDCCPDALHVTAANPKVWLNGDGVLCPHGRKVRSYHSSHRCGLTRTAAVPRELHQRHQRSRMLMLI